MKHYIIEITAKVSPDKIDPHLPAHRAFLQNGYEEGFLLISGTLDSHKGGIVVARSESLEHIKSYFQEDPLHKLHLAKYRFIEFNALKYQPFLRDWI